jgi:UDP-N-acetylmuramate dehydrogenase
MTPSTALKDLAREDIGEVLLDEPMGLHTTWRIGGPADLYAEPSSIEQAALLLRLASEAALPVVVIGEGSNVLFDDAGVRGIVLRIGRGLSDLAIEGTTVRVQAGVAAARLARETARLGLGGLEHIGGIPGSIGGLIVMNGGSRGHNIGESVVEVQALDRQGGLRVLPVGECGFTYRHSVFQRNDFVVVAATLVGTPAEPARLFEAIENCIRDRHERHPLEWPNCGSVFTNGDAMLRKLGPAGKVIEAAGLKGLRVGDAEVSEKHGNFIINRGAARSADVLDLVARVRRAVQERTGFVLECEVRYITPEGRSMPAHEALPNEG